MATTTVTDATFGVRAIGNRTDNTGAAVADLSAEEDRLDSLDIGAGFITPADSFLVAEDTVWNVDIGSGTTDTDLYVVEGTDTGQGNYIVRLDQAGAAITLTAADGSNPRKDEIWLLVADVAYDGGTLTLPRLALRTGTAAASPSAPGPDAAWNAAVLLCTIDLPAAAANIGACTLTDERAIASLVVDAASLETLPPEDFSAATHLHTGTYAVIAHEDSRSGHPFASASGGGLLTAADRAKITGVDAGADANHTPNELLTLIKSVDSVGSGIDADLLDGSPGSGYALATHLHDGTYFTETEVNTKLTAKATLDEAIIAYNSGTAEDVLTGTLSTMAFFSERREDWEGHTVPNGYITADGAGYYGLSAGVVFSSNSVGVRLIQLYHSADGIIAQFQIAAVSGDTTPVNINTVHWMGASDTITAKVYQDSGSTLTYLGISNFLEVVKLGG